MPYIARNYHVHVTGRRKGTDDQHTAVYLVRAKQHHGDLTMIIPDKPVDLWSQSELEHLIDYTHELKELCEKQQQELDRLHQQAITDYATQGKSTEALVEKLFAITETLRDLREDIYNERQEQHRNFMQHYCTEKETTC